MSKKVILTNAEALQIASQFAQDNKVNDTMAEAFAESWFDAGKDPDDSTQPALISYLTRTFKLKKESRISQNVPTPANSEPPRYLCVWIDRTPEEPHMPSTGVMRWDLRQNDWWEQWPELLAHPCAYLFAPVHPNREGPPKFADWVEAWPVGLDWEKIVPLPYHERVREILATLPPTEHASAQSDTNTLIRYAAPDKVTRALAIDSDNETSVMLRLLVKTLLGVSETERESTARLLSTLALAPDSARTLEGLKASISKHKEVG